MTRKNNSQNKNNNNNNKGPSRRIRRRRRPNNGHGHQINWIPTQPVFHGRQRARRPYVDRRKFSSAAGPLPIVNGKGLDEGMEGPARPGETPWYEKVAGIAGSLLGKAGASGIKALTGMGDYEVQTNSLLAQESGGDLGNEIPMMINSKTSNIIRHREYIGDVYGSTLAWNPTFFDINPGLDETLPWLFPLANCYTAYRVRGMIFMFKSLASEYSTTTYLGYVAMGSQYNTLEIDFPDKKTLENSEYANSTKPSKDCIHPIECAPGQLPLTELYVRNSSVPSDADQRMYDLARFCIATGGQQANGIIGELWCSYEIEFYQPKMSATSGALVQSDHFSGTGVAAATPFGTARQRNDGSTLLCTIDAETLNFPVSVTTGRFLCLYCVFGTVAGVITAPILTTANCTLVSWWNAGAAGGCTTPANTNSSQRFAYAFVVDINAKIAAFEFGAAGVLPTGTVNFDLVVTQIPSELEPGPEMSKLVARKLRGLKSTEGCVKDGKLREKLTPKEPIIEKGKFAYDSSKRSYTKQPYTYDVIDESFGDSNSCESFDEEEFLRWKYQQKMKTMKRDNERKTPI